MHLFTVSTLPRRIFLSANPGRYLHLTTGVCALLLLSACSTFPAFPPAPPAKNAESVSSGNPTSTIDPSLAAEAPDNHDEATESSDVTSEVRRENPFEAPPAEIIYGHFNQDTLSRVIIAEMAGQRGLNDKALDDYMALARETRDLGLIKRASRIATFMRDPQAATEMTELWLAQEPDSVEAYQTLALQMLAMSRYRDSMDSLETLIAMGQPLDFRIIPNRLESDPDAALYRGALIADVADLSRRYPEDQSLRLALAQLYEQNDQPGEALALVSDLAVELDNPAEVVLLEVELLESLGRQSQAMERLGEGVELRPDNLPLRFQYGRMLVNSGDFEAASQQFSAIVEQDPDDYDMLYSLALINMEMNHLKEAQTHLERLVSVGHRPNDAHYYLGYIFNQYNETDKAVENYMQVDSGSNFLQAQRDMLEILVRADRYPEARQRLQRLRYTAPDYNLPLLALESSVLLDEGMNNEASAMLNASLQAFPDNVQLLYLRSVLSTNRNDLALMEKDLRHMIALEPGNPVPYNTLGYILADRTDRTTEAYELIMKAVELAPEDPAIIDSLGWVQYRMGMLEEARSNLENAFAQFPDHEVAAHLGEVMWVMGDQRAASRLWEEALKVQPDSTYIREVMERLMPASDS